VQDHYYLSSIRHPQLIEAFNRFLEERAEQVAELRLRHGL
jgi:polar amino acid transport system substrate-binding protein